MYLSVYLNVTDFHLVHVHTFWAGLTKY